MMRVVRRGWLIAGLVVAGSLLLGSVGVVAWAGTHADGSRHVAWAGAPGRGRMMAPGQGSGRAVPDLPGTVVHAVTTDMGGPMMRRKGGTPMAGMSLRLDRTTVPHGTVSFVVTNLGIRDHELVVLPLEGDTPAGSRAVGADRRVDESGSLGEVADSSGGSGTRGVAPGATGWVTLDLPAGRYELVCNLPGHYAAGMYAEITVT